jgi:hypothetical protein
MARGSWRARGRERGGIWRRQEGKRDAGEGVRGTGRGGGGCHALGGWKGGDGVVLLLTTH